jgi:TfoX/Sxy family transcriptional regulator of competence genes
MQYYEVPVDVIEDTDALREWAAVAVSVGRKSKQRKAKRSA